MATRREFLVSSTTASTGLLSGGWSVGDAHAAPKADQGKSASLLVKNPLHPQPATFDRLPLGWYKQNVKRLQAQLAERGIDGIFINDRWNLIYFTGLFHTSTERPFACFIPTNELAVYWFHPGLDKTMVESWWNTGSDYYYDFPHAEGGYPDQGKVVTGPAVDLLEWMLKGIARRGYGEKTIGLDRPPSAKTLKRMLQILPKAKFEDVDDICIKMRRVKTPEEIALTQRALNYFSQIHVFARDYVLAHGAGLTDYKVAVAAEEYGTDLILRDVKRDGHPHNAVGISIRIGCRSGIGTAYPHPNQFHHNPIRRGDSFQVAGSVRIGGYGGELYRPYQIAPWDSAREKMWEVMAEGCAMQIRMSKAGTRCQNIAQAVHDYQVKMGMQKYLFQRVAHGEGMEGHQEPYLALGDETILEEGMTFSMEPGLFYPEGGYGYNPSDTVLVAKTTGIEMGSLPLSKEWCLLKL